MMCCVVRRSRLRAEATCVRSCWRLDANIPCGRASACSFAMLVLLCPASEKAALHSWPSNSRFNSPALIDFGGGQGRNIPHASHVFPTLHRDSRMDLHTRQSGAFPCVKEKSVPSYESVPLLFLLQWSGFVWASDGAIKPALLMSMNGSTCSALRLRHGPSHAVFSE